MSTQTHDVTESEAEPLDRAHHCKYKPQVARCWFFSQDGAEITFIANELCQKMSNPDQQSMGQLKRRERQRGQVFSQGMDNEVTTFTDSDWTGCRETRNVIKCRSDTAGQPHSEGIHARAEDLAKSSAEAELYAAALGASESKGIVSLLKDLGYELKPVLGIDAEATEYTVHRQEIGKLKQIDVAYLRI